VTDHYETRCRLCGGSDEQGCYADCPSLRKEKAMTDWADEIAKACKRDWCRDGQCVVSAEMLAATLRQARSDALEEAAHLSWTMNDDVGARIADAIRALKDKP
jgi:hypothetical protein